jgi:DNA polymerase-3 subunit gamma/tau
MSVSPLGASQSARAPDPIPSSTTARTEEGSAEKPAIGPSTEQDIVSSTKVEARAKEAQGRNNTIDINAVKAQWEELLVAIRPHNRIVEALLRDCEPVGVDGNTITIGFLYPFHREKVEEPRNKSLVTSMLGRVFGTDLQLNCIMIDKKKATQEVQKRRPKDKYQRAAEDPVIQATVAKYGAQITGVESAPLENNEES